MKIVLVTSLLTPPISQCWPPDKQHNYIAKRSKPGHGDETSVAQNGKQPTATSPLTQAVYRRQKQATQTQTLQD